MLSQEEKQVLLAVARKAIVCALKQQEFHFPVSATGGLKQPAGAFVTIRIDHKLRGCIGQIESEKPVIEVVAEVAVKAALDDPRFPAMTLTEVEEATLEISVLSPLRRINGPEEIELGTHGLVVALGKQRGLLLPQVAAEYTLDRETFLKAAMQKAGLPPYAWRFPEVELFVFEAEIAREAGVLH